jgi:hypothetical protein
MTNGEMIQKVFDCEVCEPLPEDDIIHVIFSDKNDSAIGFDWSWWNMEYKEPTAKNNLGADCISRTSALDSINWAYNLSDAYQKINDLPSVTPQEPTDKIFTKTDIDAIAKALNEGWELRANEVLDKLRAEIAELWHQYPMGHDYELAINRCLKVIDKYKVESEDNND